MPHVLEDALATRKKQEVMEDTWGHLRPKPKKVYRGTILFAHGEYGDIVPLRCHFKGLPSSPWFFEDMMEFISENLGERGSIRIFEGTYATESDDRVGAFTGDIREVDVP